ncbi:hypothetical protein [Metabacillus malikii]|uniref:Uncharacterized protein n=1 Tax=Metabacillus malikii TaxID=1504265 RepID=A0ABT9ZH52_9BACI|nr:hypothetical protein [Metabacillus malikii]MDQ0231214.1 hypothetical protein [Metabacillus malikii]
MDKEAEPKKWPKTPAFQDKDTRELLDSTEEVKDGYYLFTSYTGGYSMLWPVDAIKQFYENNGNSFERIIFGGSNKQENYSYEITTTFESPSLHTSINTNLNSLSNSLNYNGEYKEIRSNGLNIHYANKKQEINTQNGSYSDYHFFGYIHAEDSEQGLEFIYSIGCYEVKEKRACKLDITNEENRALMLMKSIKPK